ncbi:MAG: ATPase, T2SS/T4P/T4SS family [Abditibacteriales bacterium]|nr:ATPase, T2SS/T4P/T4SS family [Abditibacteriales bacterium]MDW8365652.1 ATPase, T2SS/T4P/T4SS family [Abditibacteriales bacterium]
MTDEQVARALLQAGVVTPEQLQLAASRRTAEKSLAQMLVDLGYVTPQQIQHLAPGALGQARPAPVAPPRPAPPAAAPVDLRGRRLDVEVVMKLPRDRAVALQAIPIALHGNTLTVAMADPHNLPAIDEIRRITGHRVEAVPATAAMIMQAINLYYAGSAIDQATALVGEAKDRETPMSPDLQVIQDLVADAPAIRYVNAIIEEAVRQKASDIHLEPRESGFYLRYRVDGLLRPPRELPKEWQNSIIARTKIMAGMDIAESRLPQDGRFRMNVLGRVVDFRVSSLPTLYGEKIVLRLLDRASLILDLTQLGFNEETRQMFEELILKPQGMILVTGPTGSGKSTTLYAALNRTKSETKNVVTVEDPIEYQLEGINQTQVNPRIDLTFARQLRHILRQDPDVILVGEIRDFETAEMAFRAALTGHLVLSTLHTNDAPSAMTRLVDMGIEPFLICSSVIAVLAQRLVRTICANCRAPYQPDPLDLLRIGLSCEEARHIAFTRGVGCPACGYTGFRGRVGVYELMIINEAIRDALMKGMNASQIRRLAIDHGMRTLRDDGIEKMKQGLTTPDELARVLFAFTEDEEMMRPLQRAAAASQAPSPKPSGG